MTKHKTSIMLILVLALYALVWPNLSARADGSSAPYPYRPIPEQKARDEEKSKWAQKAENLLEQNDLRDAQQAAEKALRIPGSYRGGLADELAPVYLRTGQYERAAALFGPHPDLGRNLSLNEAIALIETHRLADARKCWRESQMLPYHKDLIRYLPALSSAKGFEATVFLCRGIADVDRNHPVDGIWALHHAIQLIPNNSLALWYYGEALASADRSGEARHSFQAAIARDHGFVARRAREGMTRLGHNGDR